MADLEDVEDALLTHRDPVVKASELAEGLDCTSRHVLNLLRALERADAVESKQIGARAVAWWHVDRVCPPPGERDRLGESSPREADDQPPVDSDDHHDRAGAGVDEELEEQIRELGLPGRGDVLDARREAVRACYEHLVANGTAEKRDFLDDVRPEYPAGYESEDGWWNTIGLEGLSPLAERRDDLEKPAGGSAREYKFTPGSE